MPLRSINNPGRYHHPKRVCRKKPRSGEMSIEQRANLRLEAPIEERDVRSVAHKGAED